MHQLPVESSIAPVPFINHLYNHKEETVNQTKKIIAKKQISLLFDTVKDFDEAKLIAKKKKIPAETPGNHTMIIHRKNRRYFSNLLYNEERINGNGHPTP